ncbi:MAG TPA: tetratricopeptide repeat protein, partial [Desulfatiglandales bacterium]|nr:tetratricopeptide repeat protein [Desulfatiglandales bacterium]
AIENLKSIIRKYPAGRYTEKAYFLLAISSEKMHSDDILNHFIEVKGHYENAINRFPKSIYAPIALLGIGDLCFKTKSYSEALGYYDFILKKYGDKDSDVPIRALRSKAKILFLKKDMDRAVSNLEYLILRYPGSPEETEDKIELSKILYEMHNFRKSLNILSELTISDPEIIYYYSEISLYLGYNYYQLGESLRARENLFRFYNSCPDKEINHLVLAKIGDTYLDEGLTEDAVKLYQLVLEKFHDKEGALISLIRLAEQQEKGNLEIKRGIVSPVKVIGKEIGLANEIYEELMKNILAREEESPLVQLALLKLAIFYHKGGNYDKSLKALKDFFEKYPKTSLDKEWRYALNQTVGEILKEEMKMRRYYDVINFFAREKQLFSMVDSPGPFLDIARAFLSLNMNDMATDMFTKANVFLPDNEKPADLLYHVGSYFFKNGKHEDALSLINILINNYPSDKYAPEACQIKGTIFLEEKKYSQAAEAFSSALLYNLRRCDRAMTLANKAKALIGCNLNQRALEAIKEADSLKMNCYAYNRDIYQEIGDTYLNLGYPKEAFSTFNKALGLEDKNENKIRLKLKIAECYRALDQKKDYLALYNQISSLDDPFWSKYAKERMEEINFSGEVEELEKKEGR